MVHADYFDTAAIHLPVMADEDAEEVIREDE